jgi:GNAT superfamily N-acetyltransferase
VSRARSRVVRVGDEHLPALAGFVRAVWDPAASVEGLRAARAADAAANPVAPGEPVPTFLFLRDDQAIGHLTTIPARVAAGGRVWPAYWLKGFWVLPEHRNGPVGFLLVKEAMRHLGCALATAVEEAPRRVFCALGFRDLGALGEYVRPLEPRRMLEHLDPEALGLAARPALRRALALAQRPWGAAAGGAVLRAALGLWAAAAGRGGRQRGGPAAALDEPACDALWRRASAELAASPVRDAAYLRTRYAAQLGDRFELVTAGTDGELSGLALLRRPRAQGDPRLRGLRVALLSDAVFPPSRPAAGRALLRAAEEAARACGADALLCSASHPALRACLLRRAYAPVPGRLHFLARAPEDVELPDDLAAWWITRADGNADEVF